MNIHSEPFLSCEIYLHDLQSLCKSCKPTRSISILHWENMILKRLITGLLLHRKWKSWDLNLSFSGSQGYDFLCYYIFSLPEIILYSWDFWRSIHITSSFHLDFRTVLAITHIRYSNRDPGTSCGKHGLFLSWKRHLWTSPLK